ncbi:hypothetical protein [Vannielia sp.]|uniref:hypothetical protein n=1 Tax=Vannielia sp. TaxID=2813045 RepID=UPI002614C1E6|nr:hypothetical protein [Vannielia sp.]MDF1872275.1 hypothetical protein [Vannielia sp.]
MLDSPALAEPLRQNLISTAQSNMGRLTATSITYSDVAYSASRRMRGFGSVKNINDSGLALHERSVIFEGKE